MIKIGLLACILLLPFVMYSQISASLDNDHIRIGEPTTYIISIEKDYVQSPLAIPKDSLAGVEILGQVMVDTSLDHISLRIPITAWDSGSYIIPAYKYEQYSAPSITLEVSTVDVDTSQGIKPIYDIQGGEEEVSASRWKWFLLLIPVIGLILWLLFRRKSNGIFVSKQKKLTPYEKAMEELAQLEKSMSWNDEENLKEYYATITDSLRQFLDEVYGMHAMGSTSSQLLRDIRRSEFLRTQARDLQWLLEKGDLAKFAKTRPSIGENIEALSRAKSILNHLKPQEKEK